MGGIAQGFGKLAGSILGVKTPKVPPVTKPPGSEDPTQGSLLIDKASLQALQDQAQRRSLAQSANRSVGGTGNQQIKDSLLSDVAGTKQVLDNQKQALDLQIDTAKKTEAQRIADEQRRLQLAYTSFNKGRKGLR